MNAEKTEQAHGLVSDALANLKVIHEAKWDEHSGSVTLSEDQAECIREAEVFLTQAAALINPRT